MTHRVLVLGRDGMVGRALMKTLGEKAVGLSRTECDFMHISFLDVVDAAFSAQPFSAIFNAAAYTRVDDAESEDSGTLLRVNAVAPGELAHWCARNGVALVHFSTDYVFDGSGSEPWCESDTPAPLNAYGMSKLAGERAVQSASGRTLIFRTSWVYDGHGENFFTTMRGLMRERASLQVVNDQMGAPTYAPELALASVAALAAAQSKEVFPSGIYHLCHAGKTSWFGFAKAIFDYQQAHTMPMTCREVLEIPSNEYPRSALRPLNSTLLCEKAQTLLGIALPQWEVGLQHCFEEGAR